MKILFLSNSRGKLYSGPSYSIPAQVRAQSKYDEVFWYNSVVSEQIAWKELTYYYDIEDFQDRRLDKIINSIGKPDLIVLEQFYNHIKDPYLFEVYKSGIPYLIIPRGEFTKQGQKRSRIKKRVVNSLVANRVVKKAEAIWYLTDQEKNDSDDKWNSNSLVIPNGIVIPYNKKLSNQNSIIKVVSIGRIEPYQKGIDVLFDALSIIKTDILGRCRFDLYGANVDGKVDELNTEIRKRELENLIMLHGPVYGEDKTKILLSSDVFIMTSRFEGHPMALIEAMAYGLPCIVSQGSNMRTEVELNSAGWTYGFSSDELGQSIIKCIHDPEKKTYGENARNLAQNYDWDSIAKKTHKVFEEILRTRSIK